MDIANWPRSLRRTPIRVAIYNVLRTAEQPLTAAQVLEALKAQATKAWLSSVYRNLDQLVEVGLIRSLNLPGDSQTYFEYAGNGHLHYARCLRCHGILPLSHCPLHSYETELKESGFEIVGHRLELYGYCANCRKERT